MLAQNRILPPASMSSDKPKPKKKKRKEPSKRSSGNGTKGLASSLSDEHPRLDQRSRLKCVTKDPLTTNSSAAHVLSSATQNSAWSSSEARSTSASSAENVLTTSSSSSASAVDCQLSRRELSPTISQRRESLRWCNEFNDSDEEAERIRVYKQNRRKRYMAFLQERVGTDTVDLQKNFYA